MHQFLHSKKSAKPTIKNISKIAHSIAYSTLIQVTTSTLGLLLLITTTNPNISFSQIVKPSNIILIAHIVTIDRMTP